MGQVGPWRNGEGWGHRNVSGGRGWRTREGRKHIIGALDVEEETG